MYALGDPIDAAAMAAVAAAAEVGDPDAGPDPGGDTVWPEDLLDEEGLVYDETLVDGGGNGLLILAAVGLGAAALWRLLRR